MKSFFVPAVLFVSLIVSRAAMPNPIPLWPDGAPGALGTSSNDIPTLTPFLCESNATGAALVICPGGGYAHLAPHEGDSFAVWLSEHGVTCFVLKYRLGINGYHHPAELDDAARAVRWVRANAAEYGVDVHRVGIMGSSAGGHLASTLMTHFDAGDT
ncbi:MAG TPA: alpha/beta hydrolase, partial [Candidatus Sulfotelmatobacter sp.]|nr:alpha/beta hydrolase [Candidatus Sulfotelmatobacter sp.]